MLASFVAVLKSVLIWLSALTGSLGVGIILFTILTRIVMLPVTIKQLQSSHKLQELQPLIQELRRKYGKDQQTFTREMTKLYREHNANPAGSCLPLVVQLPIFIGVYRAIVGLATRPEVVQRFSYSFLWVPNLARKDPSYILPVVSIVLQLIVSLMATPKIQDPQQKVMSQTMLLMPLTFGFVAFQVNAGAVLYWIIGSVLAMIQQFFVSRWGSLTNYVPFLPEHQGYLARVASPLPTAREAQPGQPLASDPEARFWAPLAKLRDTPGDTRDAGRDPMATLEGLTRGKKRPKP